VFTGALLALSVGLYLAVVLARPLPTMEEVNARIAARPPVAAAHAPMAAFAADPLLVAEPVPAPEPPVVAAPVEDVTPVPAPPPAGPAKPVFLTAARGGQADDLKLIKGVGPKLEVMLHGMGVFHFDQIATWTEAEVAWVDDNLEGFKGRVTRDGWVGQARTLAAGGTV
jgi:predicted flap endonuclease-1-like 5' DNA nuclease